jgi:OOP family OmpA-OmpF porin
MKRLTFLMAVCLLTLFMVSTAFATTPKIKGFDFLVDYSMSMGWKYKKTHEIRIVLAQELLSKINSKVPGQNYVAGLHIFAPQSEKVAFGSYDRAAMGEAISTLADEYVSDRSRLSVGTGLDFFSGQYDAVARPGAVIAVTDGAYGQGRDSVNEARVFYQAHKNMCLHFISLANEPEEQALIDEMAAINPCSVSVKAEDLLNNDAAVDSFVDKVFGGKSLENTTIVMDAHSVHFAFDSAVLDQSQVSAINGVLEYLNSDADLKVKIDGYTCNIGPEDYNVSLSLRRAVAIKNYLVNKGITASRITASGHGATSPVASNDNLIGRKKNRRVEFNYFK